MKYLVCPSCHYIVDERNRPIGQCPECGVTNTARFIPFIYVFDGHQLKLVKEEDRLTKFYQMQDAINKISPWLAASLSGKECDEYRHAAQAILKLDSTEMQPGFKL